MEASSEAEKPPVQPAKLPVFGPTYPVDAGTRLAWLGVWAGCAVTLGIAIWLDPDPRGLGTHEQLFRGGMPCSFVLTSGLPCPTCGMTTSFAHMMHLQPLAAFKVQPAGAIFCLATIVVFWYSIYIVAVGRAVRINWYRIGPVRFMLAIGFILLAGWGYKLAYGLLTGQLPMR